MCVFVTFRFHRHWDDNFALDHVVVYLCVIWIPWIKSTHLKSKPLTFHCYIKPTNINLIVTCCLINTTNYVLILMMLVALFFFIFFLSFMIFYYFKLLSLIVVSRWNRIFFCFKHNISNIGNTQFNLVILHF